MNINYEGSKLEYPRKINSTLRHFIAKISGCALKQGSKTHSSLRQSNLQFGKMKLRSCLVEYERSIIESVRLDWLTHTPVCKIESCNYTRIENVHKVRKKTFNCLLRIEVQQTLSFPYSLLRHYQMPGCFYVNNCCFWARATVLSWYRNWSCSQCGQRLRWSALADKIKTIISDKLNYRGTQS